ncbi:MAG: DUF417 family protein [Hyphomicrobium sp.]|nr:DUF417 family protein [Hyphomicrobium sp.]
MLHTFGIATDRPIAEIYRLVSAGLFTAEGRGIALAGVALPLFVIGILKFMSIKFEVLRPLISNTPWLAWLDAAFGEAGAAALLGMAEAKRELS